MDRKKRILALSQRSYINKILARFSMENSKKGNLPFWHGVHISKNDCPKIDYEIENMKKVPYASAIGSLMYTKLCTRPDICYAVSVVSRYQSNTGMAHWTTVKHVLKYLRRTRDYVLVYRGDHLTRIGYTDSDFQSDKDERKLTSGYVFTWSGSMVSWRSVKQSCIANSTVKAEYVSLLEACKEVVWLKKFLKDLGVVPIAQKSIVMYGDSSGVVGVCKDPKSHKKTKHVARKYHFIWDFVTKDDIVVDKIASVDNLANPFTNPLSEKVFGSHMERMGVRFISHSD